MAQSGYTPIQLYYSTTATNTPAAVDLANGELAINIPDGKLFYNDAGVVKVIASSAVNGTVTSVSVVSANGFAGTVATSTTTPAITLTTTITGVLKGNGTAISAAVAATDYVAPSAYASANGLTMATARLLGRTTASTGSAEEITVGSGLTLSAGTLTSTGSGGTVTTVSVVSANGFTGTVANPTTTPAITLATSITGILQGDGTAISAISVGTGLLFSTGTLSNSGVTSFTSSSGLSTNTSATGAVSVTNTAPMTYPSGSGIAVVTSGTSWGTTLTAPSGAIVGTTDTQTLTNKRITSRVTSITGAAGGTITPTSDASDQYNITALGATASFAVPSGTPTDGQKLSIRIYSAAAQTISWTTTSTGYRVIGTTLPTTTGVGKTYYVGCVWNAADSFWDVVAVATQA